MTLNFSTGAGKSNAERMFGMNQDLSKLSSNSLTGEGYSQPIFNAFKNLPSNDSPFSGFNGLNRTLISNT